MKKLKHNTSQTKIMHFLYDFIHSHALFLSLATYTYPIWGNIVKLKGVVFELHSSHCTRDVAYVIREVSQKQIECVTTC